MDLKWYKPLKVLLIIWVALGLVAVGYVVFVYKKSNFILAAVFLAGIMAIGLPLRKMEEQKRQNEEQNEE